MQITEVTPINEQGKRDIYIDARYALTLSAEEVMARSIRAGQEIDAEQLQEISLAEGEAKCRQKAYSLLSFGAQSRKTLGDKLRRAGFEDTVVQKTLDRMEEMELIDDRALAERYFEVMTRTKKWGKRKMRAEMIRRGIGEEIVSEILSRPIDETAMVLDKLRSKFCSRDLSDPKEKQKIIQALLRQGFGFDSIRAAFAEMETEIE